eukprot:m.234305 g.234305  ORF g.234305 m.234305 type:complete len:51 (-) comp13914_c0_seq8:1710-1862(-)
MNTSGASTALSTLGDFDESMRFGAPCYNNNNTNTWKKYKLSNEKQTEDNR